MLVNNMVDCMVVLVVQLQKNVHYVIKIDLYSIFKTSIIFSAIAFDNDTAQVRTRLVQNKFLAPNFELHFSPLT